MRSNIKQSILFGQGLKIRQGFSFIALHPVITSFLCLPSSIYSCQASSLLSMSKPNYARTVRTGQTNSISSIRRNDGWRGSEKETSRTGGRLKWEWRVTPLNWGKQQELYLNRPSSQAGIWGCPWQERANWSIDRIHLDWNITNNFFLI